MSKENKLIKQKLVYLKGKYHLFFSLQKSNHSLLEQINLQSQFLTTTTLPDFLPENSILNNPVVFNDTLYTGYELIEDVMIPDSDVSVTNFPYYYFPNIYHHTDLNSIGLGYQIQNETQSFLHRLYLAKYINHLSFAFSPILKDNESSEVYYGGIPSQLIKGKLKGVCKVTHSNWACFMTNAFLYTKESNIISFEASNDFILFQTNEESIRAPYKFLQFLKDNIFNPFLSIGECFILRNEYSETINCFQTIKDTLPLLYVNLGDCSIKINLNELLICDPSAICDFLIKGNYLEENEWIFGTVFLKKFAVYFNMEDNTITFYSDKNNIIHNSYNTHSYYLALSLISTTFAFSLLGIIISIIIIIKRIK